MFLAFRADNVGMQDEVGWWRGRGQNLTLHKTLTPPLQKKNIARKVSVLTVLINTPRSWKFNISLITKLRNVFPFRSWHIMVIIEPSHFLSQGSIKNCQYTKQLSVYQLYTKLSVYQLSIPNKRQYTKQLSVYQTIVSVPNNCQYTKQLSVYQTTVSVPNNCQCTKQLSVYQPTVSIPTNCQYTKQLSVYQTTVSIPNNCQYTKLPLLHFSGNGQLSNTK